MESFSRVLLIFVAVLAAIQLINGGWSRLRLWARTKFVGVPVAA